MDSSIWQIEEGSNIRELHEWYKAAFKPGQIESDGRQAQATYMTMISKINKAYSHANPVYQMITPKLHQETQIVIAKHTHEVQ